MATCRAGNPGIDSENMRRTAQTAAVRSRASSAPGQTPGAPLGSCDAQPRSVLVVMVLSSDFLTSHASLCWASCTG